MNTTHTASSPYRTIPVRIDGSHVYAANGAFLGDVEGMGRLGWEFTRMDVADAECNCSNPFCQV